MHGAVPSALSLTPRHSLIIAALALFGLHCTPTQSQGGSETPDTVTARGEDLTAVQDSTVLADAADESYASYTAVRNTIYVSKTCGSQPCTDSSTCGLTTATACASLHQGLVRLISVSAQANSNPGADVLSVAYASTPYYANHTFYWDAGAGTAAHPKVIQGQPGPDAQKPLIEVDPDQVPYSAPSGYVSGRKPSTSKPQPAAFSFSGSSYWVVENLEIDCKNTPQDSEIFSGINIVGDDQHRAGHIMMRRLDISRCGLGAIDISAADDVAVLENKLHNNRLEEFKSNKWLRKDSNAVGIIKSTRRVHIARNVAFNNSGDGVQCQGRLPGQSAQPITDDPAHIIIEDNTFHGNDENAVDIKTCHRVNVKGYNHFFRYRSSDNNGEDPNNLTQCSGDVIILHEGASQILIQEALIEDAGIGIAIGNENYKVEDVIIRRNRIVNMNQESVVFTSSGTRVYNCGDGIRVYRGDRIDIYHNTLHNIAHSGIRVGVDSYADGANYVRVWNNILSDVRSIPYQLKNAGGNSTKLGGALDYRLDNAAGLYSQNNLFYRDGGQVKFVKAVTSGSSVSLTPYTLSQWQVQMATSVESQGYLDNPPGVGTSGSEESNPLFEDTINFLTQSGSLARNSAIVDDGNAGTSQRCNLIPDKGVAESDCGAGVCQVSRAAATQGPRLTSHFQAGTCGGDLFSDVATGTSGVVIVGGSSAGNFAATTAVGNDAILRQYTSTGTVDWTVQFGSPGNDSISAVATDSSGNIYVVGTTTGTVDTAHPNQGQSDAFITKYSSAGQQLWIRQLGTADDDSLSDVIVNPSNGDIYAVGSTTGDFGTPSTSFGYSPRALVVRIQAGGTLQTAEEYGDINAYGFNRFNSVAVDSSGNIIAAGCGPSTMDIGPYVHKLNPSLTTTLWEHRLDSPEYSCASSVVVDSNGRAIYSAAFDSESSSGNLQLSGYVTLLNGSTGAYVTSFGLGARKGYAMTLGTGNALFIAGRAKVNNAPAGFEDLFVSRFDLVNAVYTQTWDSVSGTGEACSGGDAAYGLALDSSGAPVAAGKTCGPLFGPTPPVHYGASDAILMKYQP